MKKLFCVFLAICLLVSLSACRRNRKDPTADNNTNGTQSQNPTGGSQVENDTPLVAVSLPTQTQNETSADGTVLFQYTFQHMTLVLHKPQVADKIILDFVHPDLLTASDQVTDDRIRFGVDLRRGLSQRLAGQDHVRNDIDRLSVAVYHVFKKVCCVFDGFQRKRRILAREQVSFFRREKLIEVIQQ